MEEAGLTLEQAMAMLQNIPEPNPVSWRLYYDEYGKLITYSMEDLPGNYIEIDAATFQRGALNVRVIDGKLKYTHQSWSQKLVPTDTGTPCHPQDICVIADTEPVQHWSRKLYESIEN